MKVLVPLNHLEHIDDYIECGAGEFYVGFYDKEWEDRFGDYSDINRISGFKADANQNDFEGLLKVIEKVKKKDSEIYVTFNSSIYSEEEFTFIEKYMPRLKEVNVDGIIVSCTPLIEIGKKYGLNTVISTIAGIYNEDIARFYYEQGAKRLILPRDLSLLEIEAIVQAVPQAEYEVFIMRNGCVFSDSNCLGMHRNERTSICRTICNANNEIRMKNKDFKSRHAVELNDMIYNHSFHANTCGLCSIYRFVQLGITAGKIVGRSDNHEKVCQDIRYVKNNVEIAKTCASEEEFLERMQFPEDSTAWCKLGLSCYYPEVRF